MYPGWEDIWVDAFSHAAAGGADCGTARAIAWAKVSSARPRERNPAAAAAPAAGAKKKSKKRRKLHLVPPLRKGKPSTWRVTKTGEHRARLGTLPPKWRSEWVRVYKNGVKGLNKRADLNENQVKTVAAMMAWNTIKKMGCRLPSTARPARGKTVATPPNKRARDRDKRFDGWICPEWETTERAREKVIEEVRKESRGVERRERSRRRKEEAEIKKGDRAREKSRRDAEKAAKKIRKKVVEKQTAREYSEGFKKAHGKYGLLPPEPRAKKKKAKKAKGKSQRVPRGAKKYDKSQAYKVGDILNHPKFGIGLVRIVKGKTMEVKFQNRTDGIQVRKIRMGG